jgi:hypothetical protein
MIVVLFMVCWRPRYFGHFGSTIDSDDRVRLCYGRICHCIVENGLIPDLPAAELEALGFSIAAYPLSLMSAAMKAMIATLDVLRSGQPRDELLLKFCRAAPARRFL